VVAANLIRLLTGLYAPNTPHLPVKSLLARRADLFSRRFSHTICNQFVSLDVY
jgi:hypothetical protein